MRFFILDTDYPEFLRWLYSQHFRLERKSYAEQMLARAEGLFGLANFYAMNLRRLGHEASDFYANNEPLQSAWALEHGHRTKAPGNVPGSLTGVLKRARDMAGDVTVPYLGHVLLPLTQFLRGKHSWPYQILERQIRHHRPDVLLILNIAIDSRFLRKLRPHIGMLVGQHASPIPEGQDLSVYDLMISSLPNVVEHFRQEGLRSELQPLGFEPSILGMMGDVDRSVQVSFVGSLSENHTSRQHWLNDVCRHLEVGVWGRQQTDSPPATPTCNGYRGEAWGLPMFQILRRSMITLNHHIDMAESYANNMRLFEATGVGTLLVTDWKDNLDEMFTSGKDVVAYRSSEECIELVRYYLENDEEREAIARRGQERTLREHTYYARMQALVKSIHEHM